MAEAAYGPAAPSTPGGGSAFPVSFAAGGRPLIGPQNGIMLFRRLLGILAVVLLLLGNAPFGHDHLGAMGRGDQ